MTCWNLNVHGLQFIISNDIQWVIIIHIVNIMVMIQKHWKRLKVQMSPEFKFKINKIVVSLSCGPHKFNFDTYAIFLDKRIFRHAYRNFLDWNAKTLSIIIGYNLKQSCFKHCDNCRFMKVMISYAFVVNLVDMKVLCLRRLW